MYGADECVEILYAAEQWIDPGVIGNVVTESAIGEGKIGDSQTASTPSASK